MGTAVSTRLPSCRWSRPLTDIREHVNLDREQPRYYTRFRPLTPCRSGHSSRRRTSSHGLCPVQRNVIEVHSA
jgi:hypothetical protein